MKTAFFYLVLLVSVPLSAQSPIPKNPNKVDKQGRRQGTWTVLINQSLKPTEDTSKAVFYRIISYKDDSPVGVVRQYYRSGGLYMEGVWLADRPDGVPHGKMIWYYENGAKQLEAEFEQGRVIGKAIMYDLNGQKQTTDILSEIVQGYDFYKQQRYKEALDMLEKHNGMLLEGFKDKPEKKIDYLLMLGTCYSNTGQLDKLNEVINMIKTQDDSGWHHLFLEGIYLHRKGKYREAIDFIAKAKNIVEKKLGIDNEYYAHCLNNLTSLYNEIGDYKSADFLWQTALQNTKKMFGENNRYYAATLNNLAIFYYHTGFLQKAEPLLMESLRLTEKWEGLLSNTYLAVSGNLALLYMDIKKYVKADSMFRVTEKIMSQLNKTEDKSYALLLNNWSKLFEAIGNNELSLKIQEKALDISLRAVGDLHPVTLATMNSLADGYTNRGYYEKADSLFQMTKAIKEKVLRKNNPSYTATNTSMANLYSRAGDYAKASILFQDSFRENMQLVRDYFPVLSEMEKQKFFETFDTWHQMFYSFVFKYMNEKSDVAGQAYDVLLATKALVFQNSNNVRKHILNNTKDTSLTVYYNRWLDYKSQLIQAYQLSAQEIRQRGWNVSSMEEETNKMEKELSKRSTEFVKNYNKKYPTWLQLQKNLKSNEAAIEIIRMGVSTSYKDFEMIGKGLRYDSLGNITRVFQVSPAKRAGLKVGDVITEINNNSVTGRTLEELQSFFSAKVWVIKVRSEGKIVEKTIVSDSVFSEYNLLVPTYMAFVVTTNSSYPKSVLLTNGEVLEEESIYQYRNLINSQQPDTVSYHRFWQPLASHLKGIKKVYLSPDGVYHQIALQTLRNPATGKYLADETEVQVVSSTRDLIDKPTTKPVLSRAELFGHPDYAADPGKPVPQPDLYAYTPAPNRDSVQNATRAASGEKLRPLPSSRAEVERVGAILARSGVKVKTYTDAKATERQLKQLQSPSVLLVSTHGFFMQDVNRKPERTFAGFDTQKFVENPLLRSGLFMAGSQRTLNGETAPTDTARTEDGILTAYEAMNLNLDKTELVVLSACETGLGEVKNGEGVYGLQRAFQTAGARSVLMSLWKVDDAATQELMTAFFENWMKLKDKRAALKAAQNKLRTNPKYSHPYYWGAFVLVGE